MTHDEAALHARLLREVVEPARRRAGLSLREAGRRSAMSEASWRQLVAGGVRIRGTHVERRARRDQVLRMAHAADCLADVAGRLGASAAELERLHARLPVIDPAEQEILALRHLHPEEKLRLVALLKDLRAEG